MDYRDAVRAVDDFCAGVRHDRGDRVTVSREALGETVCWLFALDDVELGVVKLSPRSRSREGYGKTEYYTALVRGADQGGIHGIPPEERSRHRLFGAILRELDDHLQLWSGKREPAATLKRRVSFRTGEACGDKAVRVGGPHLKTETYFEVFARIKDEHPNYTQGNVATAAMNELGDDFLSSETVRNVYRKMRMPWKRGTRDRYFKR